MKTILSTIALFFMSSLLFAQNKIYASNETHQVSGICLGCSVENPQNAVGSNEDDYSTLKIGIGVIGKVEQTLIFPSSTTKKVIIGIGTSNIPLSVSLLQGVSVETFNGDISNNDLQFIDSNILKLGSQTNKATIELSPSKPYDHIKISLHGGLLNLSGGLQMYYAYNLLPSICNSSTFVPLPIHYYSFNGNTNDIFNNYNLPAATPQEFKNNMICNQGLDINYGVFTTPQKNISLKEPKTVSFWARVGTVSNQHSASIKMNIYGKEFKITPDSIIIKTIGAPQPATGYGIGSMIKNHPNYNQLTHYTLTFKDGPIADASGISAPYVTLYQAMISQDVCLYINGDPAYSIPTQNQPHNFPTQVYCTKWGPQYSTGNGSFSISMNNAEMDELLIYDKEFKKEDVKALHTAYNLPSSLIFNTNTLKTTSIEDVFTISPNPTTGQITLNGNILLLDADISIRNTSGTEVYYSKFRSKTFDLPSNLPGGVYILSLQTKDKKIYTRKIILTR